MINIEYYSEVVYKIWYKQSLDSEYVGNLR
jgi:hypothetical protein